MKKNNLDGMQLKDIIAYTKHLEKKCDKSIIISIFISLSSLFLFPELLIIFLSSTLGVSITSLIKIYKLQNNFDKYYMNSKEYQDVFQLYKIFLNDLAKLFKELDFNNEAKIFAGYSFMLKYGFLSTNHLFVSGMKSMDCSYLLGSDIINGSGECRNVNSALTDLLKTGNYEAYDIGMKINSTINKILNDDYYLNEIMISQLIELNSSLEGGIFNPEHIITLNEIMDKTILNVNDISKILNIFGNSKRETNLSISKEQRLLMFIVGQLKNYPNHLATLFKNEQHCYIMDAYNDTLYMIDENNCVYQDNNYYAVNNKFIYPSVNIKYKLAQTIKPTSPELIEKIISDYKIIYSDCHNLKDIFELFYREHIELYQDVIVKKRILKEEFDKKYGS